MWMCKKDAGYTLLELLIALTITSILVGGLFMVYLNSKEHHMRNNQAQEMAEEINFTRSLFEQGVRGVGYLGLSNWRGFSVYDSSRKIVLNDPIILWNSSNEDLPENIQKKIKPNTEAIELKQMDFRITNLSEKANKNAAEISVEKNNAIHWKENDYILIADYLHGEINQIIKVKNLSSERQSIQLNTPLHYAYEKFACVGGYLDEIYFIGNTGHYFPNKKPIYGLYVYSANHMTEEITDFISDMHFEVKNKQVNQNFLNIMVEFTLPYWIKGKYVSKGESFFIASRE